MMQQTEPPNKNGKIRHTNDEEVDVTARVTFTTPQNVLDHNTITINNVAYKLDS
jgi:hypothetical protein